MIRTAPGNDDGYNIRKGGRIVKSWCCPNLIRSDNTQLPVMPKCFCSASLRRKKNEDPGQEHAGMTSLVKPGQHPGLRVIQQKVTGFSSEEPRWSHPAGFFISDLAKVTGF